MVGAVVLLVAAVLPPDVLPLLPLLLHAAVRRAAAPKSIPARTSDLILGRSVCCTRLPLVDDRTLGTLASDGVSSVKAGRSGPAPHVLFTCCKTLVSTDLCVKHVSSQFGHRA